MTWLLASAGVAAAVVDTESIVPPSLLGLFGLLEGDLQERCQFAEFMKIHYICSMSGIFLALMGIAMVAVLGALGVGLYAMTRGGEFNQKYSNKLMQLRVGLQATAVALFVIAMWMGKGNN